MSPCFLESSGRNMASVDSSIIHHHPQFHLTVRSPMMIPVYDSCQMHRRLDPRRGQGNSIADMYDDTMTKDLEWIVAKGEDLVDTVLKGRCYQTTRSIVLRLEHHRRTNRAMQPAVKSPVSQTPPGGSNAHTRLPITSAPHPPQNNNNSKEKRLTAIDLLARLRGIGPLLETDKRKPLRAARLPVLGQEHPRHAPEALEDLPQVLLLRELRHVRHPQRGQVVALVLAAHALPGRRRPSLPHVWWHVAAAALAQPPRGVLTAVGPAVAAGPGPGAVLAHGRHRVLEGAPRGEVLAVADAAAHFLVLQLVAHALLLAFLLARSILPVSLPGHARAEDDVLAHARGVEGGADGVSLLEAELGPAAPRGDGGVDGLADDGGADAAGGLNALAVVVEAVGDDGLGAVFVGRDGLGGQGGGVVEFFVIGPVGAAAEGLVS